MNNKVITFYDPSTKLKDPKLLNMWMRNWEYHGWEPEVKNLKDAFSVDPIRFKKWEKSTNLYKGSWDKKYIFICYARWLTMIREGGIMVDSDVFNYGFTPEDCGAIGLNEKVIHLSGDCTPCATIGLSVAYEKYVQAFDDYNNSPYFHENLKEHVHDMHIISSREELFDSSVKICSLYGSDKSWENYPLIHFTHGRVPFPRSRNIPRIKRFGGMPVTFLDRVRQRLQRIST
jgi:hypothetical protein